MSERQRIPEPLLRQIDDCLRSEDWINEQQVEILNDNRIAHGGEPLNMRQWRCEALLTRQQAPEHYRRWRQSAERTLEETRCRESRSIEETSSL